MVACVCVCVCVRYCRGPLGKDKEYFEVKRTLVSAKTLGHSWRDFYVCVEHGIIASAEWNKTRQKKKEN